MASVRKTRPVQRSLDEEGAREQLERSGEVRLDAEEPEPAREGDVRDRAHVAGAPVGGAGRYVLQGAGDYVRDLLVVLGVRGAGPQLVARALDAAVQIALAPLADSLRGGADPAATSALASPSALASIMRVCRITACGTVVELARPCS